MQDIITQGTTVPPQTATDTTVLRDLAYQQTTTVGRYIIPSTETDHLRLGRLVALMAVQNMMMVTIVGTRTRTARLRLETGVELMLMVRVGVQTVTVMGQAEEMVHLRLATVAQDVVTVQLTDTKMEAETLQWTSTSILTLMVTTERIVSATA